MFDYVEETKIEIDKVFSMFNDGLITAEELSMRVLEQSLRLEQFIQE